MVICKKCGEQNPDGTNRCNKCGIALLHQQYEKQDAKRAQIGLIIRSAAWLAALIVLAVVGPPIYHFGRAAYLKHHLKSITEGAMRACDGPVTDTMGPAQVDQINKCLAQNADLTEAKTDYESFTKNDKP